MQDYNRRYGYMSPQTDKVTVSMKKGQNIAGYPIGIIYIDDVYYPMLPGNIVNGYTFDFPVRLKAVKNLDVMSLFNTADGVEEIILKACRELEREGVRAISSACGFFGNYQKAAAKALNIPAALSSLIQLPWIAGIIKPDGRIGVLTASSSSVTDRLLDNCGITDELKERLVIKGLEHEKEFSCIIEGRGSFDNKEVCREVVGKARQITEEYPDTGAILLECSDMPPYAYAVMEATGLPVFDFTTLIKWLHSSVTQKPYCGFI